MPRLIWIGLILCSALFALSKLVPTFLHAGTDPLLDRDFSNLWMAGRLAIDGQVGAIFDIEAFQAASHEALDLNFPNVFGYPPHALFLAIPFGALPYPAALLSWTVVSLAFFTWAARPFLSPALPAWVVLMSPASLLCLAFGQYGLICGALWLLAFRNKGWAAALLTIKPHLGLLVFVQMLRDRRALISAILLTLILIGLSLIAFGTDPWRAFFSTTFNFQLGYIDGDRPAVNKNMIAPIIGYGLFGQVAFAAAAILLLHRAFNVFTAATATFLILPYAFHYDMTVVCLGFAVLLATRWNDLATWQKIVACLAFLSPGLAAMGSWVCPPLLLAGLYVQIRAAEKSGETDSGGDARPVGDVHPA